MRQAYTVVSDPVDAMLVLAKEKIATDATGAGWSRPLLSAW